MLGLLLVFAVLGFALAVLARRRALRWIGAGLGALSLILLAAIVALVFYEGRPTPLPEVHRVPATQPFA